MGKEFIKEIEASFKIYKANSKAHIILFRGKRVIVSSGKSLWNGKGPAKNALNNHLSWFKSQINYYSDDYPNTQESDQQREEDLKAFEKWIENNIQIIPLIEYEKLKNYG